MPLVRLGRYPAIYSACEMLNLKFYNRVQQQLQVLEREC
jgi:hypothetical protein